MSSIVAWVVSRTDNSLPKGCNTVSWGANQPLAFSFRRRRGYRAEDVSTISLTVAYERRERVQQKAPPAIGQVGLSGGWFGLLGELDDFGRLNYGGFHHFVSCRTEQLGECCWQGGEVL